MEAKQSILGMGMYICHHRGGIIGANTIVGVSAPEEFRAQFSPESVVLSPNAVFDDAEAEAFARKEAAGYYAHIAALDTCVGTMTKALKDLGLEENTILVFASDHGEMMGSHGKQPYMKQVFWDESCRVPYLLRYPPLTADCAGRRRTTPLGTVDIMPTLLGLCGLEVPAAVEGEDLSACVRDGVEIEGHAALYMSVSPFSGKNFLESAYRAVRTRRHTFSCPSIGRRAGEVPQRFRRLERPAVRPPDDVAGIELGQLEVRQHPTQTGYLTSRLVGGR